MDRRAEQIGYVVNKQGNWSIVTKSGVNVFESEFSAKYYASVNNIRLISSSEYLKKYKEYE